MVDYWNIDQSFFTSRSKRRSVMTILKNSSDGVNLRDKNGWTVLHCIVRLGNVSYTKALLEMGADVNAMSECGFTPLHIACIGNHKQCIEVILDYEPFMDVKHLELCTPLHIFVMSEMLNEHTLKKILCKGADPNIRDKNGNTPLHLLALQKRKAKKREFARLLIEYNADVNSKNNEGYTPLHSAIRENCEVLVDVFLKNDADINIRDNNCVSPVMMAYLKHLKNMTVLTLLGKHLIILYNCNIPVDMFAFNHLLRFEYFFNFIEKCSEELLTLKQTVIPNSNVTYYDILVASPLKVGKYVRNSDIFQALVIFDDSKYIFGKRIMKNVLEGIRRNKATVKLHEIFGDIFSPLPDLCIEKIMEYIDCKDLKTLEKL